MMKRVFMMVSGMAALVGCTQVPVTDTPATAETATTVADKPQNYVALPGQAATSSTPSETTRAFEFAAAAYNAGSTPASTPAPAPVPAPTPTAASPAAQAPLFTPVQQPTQAATPCAPYAVQLENGTTGRLFIEAQDEGGNIFPFGFMHAGQRVSTQPQDPYLISGRLIVIVRDPDRPGAPELRRYYVDPPAKYEGKTIGVTILPGGRYRASLEGKVYYVSPEPVQPAQQ